MENEMKDPGDESSAEDSVEEYNHKSDMEERDPHEGRFDPEDDHRFDPNGPHRG